MKKILLSTLFLSFILLFYLFSTYTVYSQTPTPTAGNLLRNPGFETDGDNNNRPDNWSSDPYDRFTKSSTSKHSGSFSGRFSLTDGSNSSFGIGQNVTITEGIGYSLSGWVNIPATSDAFGLNFELKWRETSSSTSYIRIDQVKRYYNTGTSGWVQFTSPIYYAPAGSSSVKVNMYASSLNGTFYVDDLVFLSGSASNSLLSPTRTPTGPTRTPSRTPTRTSTPTPVGNALYTSENINLIIKIIKNSTTNNISFNKIIAVKDGFLEDYNTLHKAIGSKTHVLEQVVNGVVQDSLPINFIDHIDSPPPKPGTSETIGDLPVKLANPEAVLTVRHIYGASYRVRDLSSGTLTYLSQTTLDTSIQSAVFVQSFAKDTYLYSRSSKNFSKIATSQVSGTTADDAYFDILFLSSAYTDFNLFISDASAISQFILGVSPYSDLANQIRITAGTTTQDLGCVYYGRGIGCDATIIRAVAAAWNYDTVVVIHNSNVYGGGVNSHGIAATYRNVNEWARHVALHEMGHSVANLADEYSYGRSSTYNPDNIANCALYPCSKWAGTPGTGCFQTCAFTDWYRPTNDGCIMRSLVPADGIKFDEADRKVMYDWIVQDISGPVPTLQPLYSPTPTRTPTPFITSTPPPGNIACTNLRAFNSSGTQIPSGGYVVAGESFNYRIDYANFSTTSNSGTINGILPNQLTISNLQSGCSNVGNTLICNLTMNPISSDFRTIQVRVLPSVSGSFSFMPSTKTTATGAVYYCNSHTLTVTTLTPTRTPTRTPTGIPTAGGPSPTRTRTPTPASTSCANRSYAINGSLVNYLEAEKYSGIASDFTKVVDAYRSGGAYMHTPNNAGSSTGTFISFNLNVVNGGTFYVWLLGYGLDSSSDSFYINLDNGNDISKSLTVGSWSWQKVGTTFSIGNGIHTLRIKEREDGSRIDKILLTKSSITPTGLGGTALNCQ